MPNNPVELAYRFRCPSLVQLIGDYLATQPEYDHEYIPTSFSVYPSLVVHFHAPNEQSNLGGMTRERIRCVEVWRRGPPRLDCAYVYQNDTIPGFGRLAVVRILLLFSFRSVSKFIHQCALVSCYSPVGDEPDAHSGMWVVEPAQNADGTLQLVVIPIHQIVRAAHLIGHAGNDPVPLDLLHTDSLDAFTAFYVNKYIDYHAHTIEL